MNETYNKLLTKIKKNYKNTQFILDIYLENYHNRFIYFRIDYYKKIGEYKLSWLDLTNSNNKIDNLISYELMPQDAINKIITLISKIKPTKATEEITDNYKVTINSTIKNRKEEAFNLIFNHYIPKEYPELVEIMYIIFDYLPKRLFPLFDEFRALIFGNTGRYEYVEAFHFDLFNDDLSNIFDKDILKRGNKYYEEGRVFFLEKIGETYYAVVGGTNLYVIKIGYHEKEKMMQVYCNCPCDYYCKHICAVIQAIRNNKFHKFYKIINQNENVALLDIVMDFKFFLCIGIDDQNLHYLVIQDDILKVLPILDRGESLFKVLEDDEHNTLSKRLETIINKK